MNPFLSPGMLLMRSLSLPGKLGLLALAAVVPMVVGALLTGAPALWVAGVGGVVFIYLMLCFYSSFVADLQRVMAVMQATAAGNLRQDIKAQGSDELAQMAGLMAQMVNRLSAMVAAVRSNAALVAHAGGSLASGNRALSDRTEQQAANLEETSASVADLSSTVQQNAHTAQQSDRQASSVRATADTGAQAMTQAIQSVEAIQASTQRMDEIVGVIDGLAFQTNILALNAAVEAARAGESGRGFAVVAAEVRSLAQRSAASAKEIRQLISTSSSQVATGVAQIRTAGANITQIVDGIRGVAVTMSEISTSNAEQSNALNEIATAVRQLDTLTQQNASMVERAVEQSNLLEGRASTLAQAVAEFQLQQGTAEEAMHLVRAAARHRQRAGTLESFLRDITEPSQGFHDRDMYVFVLDDTGRYVAFGGNKAKVGTRVQDIAGIDGDGLLRSIMHQASHEPGWVEYDITNPASGKVQTKMSYVQMVDHLYMGCGVYKALAAK